MTGTKLVAFSSHINIGILSHAPGSAAQYAVVVGWSKEAGRLKESAFYEDLNRTVSSLVFKLDALKSQLVKHEEEFPLEELGIGSHYYFNTYQADIAGY